MADKDSKEDSKEIKLLGFNFTKLLVEKNPNFKGTHSIESNIDLKSIEKHKLELLREEAVKVVFNFVLNYKELGKVEIAGDLLLLLDEKTKKQVLDEWKDKKLPNDIRLIILNIILQKSSLKALQLEEELGLPFHMQLPSLQLQNPKQVQEAEVKN
jgi:hypothetical protein